VEVPSIAVAAIICVAVLVAVLPYIGRLLALWVCPSAAKGTFQKKVVTELLTIKDRLEGAGQQAASKLVKDSVIALISGEEGQELPQVTQPKSLFGK
jgi:hypothetical protein